MIMGYMIYIMKNKKQICDSSSVGRASPCQGEGREFKPHLSL